MKKAAQKKRSYKKTVRNWTDPDAAFLYYNP